MEGDAPAPATRGRGRGRRRRGDIMAQGRKRGLRLGPGVSGSLLTSPLTLWRAMTSPHQPIGLEYEEVSLAPMVVRPRWLGGVLEASLVWVV